MSEREWAKQRAKEWLGAEKGRTLTPCKKGPFWFVDASDGVSVATGRGFATRWQAVDDAIFAWESKKEAEHERT